MYKRKSLIMKNKLDGGCRKDFSPFSIGVSQEPNSEGKTFLPVFNVRMNDNKSVEIGVLTGIRCLTVLDSVPHVSNLIFNSPDPKPKRK
jgi:hypothetical protein